MGKFLIDSPDTWDHGRKFGASPLGVVAFGFGRGVNVETAIYYSMYITWKAAKIAVSLRSGIEGLHG